MMDLKTQIITFLFSILFELLFSSLIDIFYNKKKLFNTIIVFLITVLSSLAYFFVLLKLNNAIIHPYYIIAFVVGFLLEIVIKKILKRFVLLLKK